MYQMRREQRSEDGFFGLRGFADRNGKIITGELFQEHGKYFAAIGDAVYNANMLQRDDGKREWRIEDRRPV